MARERKREDSREEKQQYCRAYGKKNAEKSSTSINKASWDGKLEAKRKEDYKDCRVVLAKATFALEKVHWYGYGYCGIDIVENWVNGVEDNENFQNVFLGK